MIATRLLLHQSEKEVRRNKMGLKSGYPDVEDIVIIDHGIVGTYAYRVTEDILHVRLERVDRNEYVSDMLFDSFTELKEYIENNDKVTWIPLKK